MLVANLPKQDKQLTFEEVTDACPSIPHYQVDQTNVSTGLMPKPSTKKANSRVPTYKVSESDNISDQVPGGKRQVPAYKIRFVPCCLTSRPPYHVHS